MIETSSTSRTSILVVPVLSIVGLLSAIFTLPFWFTFSTEYQSEFLFALLQSLILGLAVSAVLWGFEYIRRWTKFIAVVAAIVGAHSLERFLDSRLPQQTLLCWDCSSTSSFTTKVAIHFFLVSSIVFIASVGLIEPRPKVHWILLTSLASSMLGSVAIGFLDAWAQREKAGLAFNGQPLWLLWQPTMAAFLGVAVWAGSLRQTSPQASIPHESKPQAHNRYSALYILGFFVFVIVIWGGTLAHRQKEVTDEKWAWTISQIARSIQETPPLANLPNDEPAPIEEVMETNALDDWKMYSHEAHRLNAQASENGPVLPDREQYTARFAKAKYDYPVSVTITQFPNSAWARFELRNTPMQSAFFTQHKEILRITRFGGILYQDGPYLYWSSGDKLIFLDCSGTLPADINRFLGAYTRKYPSSIQHSDELEQLVGP
jgi:hypothetical protein